MGAVEVLTAVRSFHLSLMLLQASQLVRHWHVLRVCGGRREELLAHS